ncbi:unknown [Clostridium sp. CAG:230]|nr:unknown [Clostridium sp. CAG:230]
MPLVSYFPFVIRPYVNPINPQITNVNGAHATHPFNRSNNPRPNAPVTAPSFLPKTAAATKTGTFPR